MHPNDANPERPAGQARMAHRGLGYPLLIAGLFGVFLGGLVYLAGVLRGLWNWDPWASREPQATAVRAAESKPVGPIASGRVVYQARCVHCHGPDGRGGREDGANHRPEIRDLAAPSWRTPAAAETVRRIITQGIPAQGMPGTGNSVSAAELDSLVDYVLSLEITDLAARAGFSPAPGSSAPPISFRDAAGFTRSLEHFRGKVVLLAFWGTTCIPCIKELPDIAKLALRFRETDLVILPVCLDEADPQIAGDVAARIAPGLAVSVDAEGSARRKYEVLVLPQAFLIDREGRVVVQAFGARKWDLKEIDELFCAAMGVPGPPALAEKTAVSRAGP